MSKYLNTFCINDLIVNEQGKVLMVVDILHDGSDEYIYECSDGNLYYGYQLRDKYNG